MAPAKFHCGVAFLQLSMTKPSFSTHVGFGCQLWLCPICQTLYGIQEMEKYLLGSCWSSERGRICDLHFVFISQIIWTSPISMKHGRRIEYSFMEMLIRLRQIILLVICALKASFVPKHFVTLSCFHGNMAMS